MKPEQKKRVIISRTVVQQRILRRKNKMRAGKNVLKKLGALALAASVIVGIWAVSAQPVSAATGNYQVKKTSYSKTYKLADGTKYFTVKAKIPQIEDDSEAAQKINQTLTKEKNKLIRQWKKNSVTYKSDYAEMLDGIAEDETRPEWTYGDSVVYKVTNNDKNYFSVVMDGYLFLGGAHGSPYRICLTFDAKTGEKLTASKLLGISKAKVNQKVKNLYLKKCDKLGEDAAMYFYASDDVRATLQESLKELDFNNAFYVKNGKAVFYAEPYAVGPYAAGYIEVSTAIK